jgi:hypothetical protein
MKDNQMVLKTEDALDVLRSVPPRNPGAAARGKTNFLQQASVMRSSVSRKQETRHNGWINTIFPVFPRKEHRVMNAMIAVIVAVVMFFGGTGTTVYAAQASLPDQPLYPLKTWSEDTLLALTGSPRSRLNYALDFSDRRITEMAGLLSAGRSIPEMTMVRLQNELQQALELAAGMEDPQMVQGLEQIRLRAETQIQKMTVLMSQAQQSAQPALLQAQLRLQDQVRLCTLGLTDPQGFRLQVQQRQRNQDGMQHPTGLPVPTRNGYGPGPGNGPQTPVDTTMPTGNSNGSGSAGNQPTGTPGQSDSGQHSPAQTPQSGNGPQGTATQEPANTPMPTGNGNGTGNGGNQPTGTPGQKDAGQYSPSQTP